MSSRYSGRRAIVTALIPVVVVVACVTAAVRAFPGPVPERRAEPVTFPGERWSVGYARPLDKVQARCVITSWSPRSTGAMRPLALRVPRTARCDRRLVPSPR